MHVEYIPCHTQAELCSKMKTLSEGSDAPQFLEATVYSKDTAVIMACHFADKPADSALINHVNYFWKPWYYVHVEQVSSYCQCNCSYRRYTSRLHHYTAIATTLKPS
jgi:Delta24-sterol reductase